MMKRIHLLLLFILMQCTLSAQVIFNYDAITICEGDSYDLLKYQNNEVIVPVGWEIIGWSGISNTTVTPTVSPTAYTLQYREIANPSVILTHDLSITIRPKPAVSISPKGSQIICVGQPIHIDKVSATNYDNLYWQYVQKGDKYYTDAIDATAVQGNIDNKMTYKLIATNNHCAVLAQDQMEYSVIRDDAYPIYRFYLTYTTFEGAPRLNYQINYCGTTDIATYMTPAYIVVSSKNTGDMAFDPYSDDRYITLPTNIDYLYLNPNWAQKSENDMVKITRYDVKWETDDQYTQGAVINGISYSNKYTLEVDLYFKACGTTKTYYYTGELKLNPYCPVYDYKPWISFYCSEINGQGQFGVQNPGGANTINKYVWENLTVPGEYLPQGTDNTYRYAQFDNNAPAQMKYRVTIDYLDENAVAQQMVAERTFNTCYVKKQISYASAKYEYGFTPWLVYNGYYAPNGAEASNYEGKTKVDTIETTVCMGSPAYLSIASNVKGPQKVLWRNSERPTIRTQYNEPFYDYTYNRLSSGYEFLIDSITCQIFKVTPTQSTVYTGTLEGLEFAYKVNVVNNHIAAIDTAICRGQSIDLKILERISNINGTVAWNISNTLVTPAVDTKYTVYGIARDKCPGQADYTITDNVTVHVDEQLWSTASEFSSCAGDQVDLKEFLNSNVRTLKWYSASGDLLQDGIVKVAGDTYYTVQMTNGCGTKLDTIQVKETTACYDYEFAQNDSLSKSICASTGKNNKYPIWVADLSISPLLNDGSMCDEPVIKLLTETTILGNKAMLDHGKIFYDTSFENIINYSGQKDSVQYEVSCEFKKDSAWAYFEIRDEQVLKFKGIEINTDGTQITIKTEGVVPQVRKPIAIDVWSEDGVYASWVDMTNKTEHTFTKTPAFVDGKYYVNIFNLGSLCSIEDSIVLRGGQILPGGTCTTSDTTRIDTTILKGQSYSFGGKTYTDTASDTLRLKNSAACDSVVILNLMAVALKSDSYIACPGAKVTLELTEIVSNTYSWYSARTGGALLSSLSSLEHTKTAAFIDTVWLQVNNKARIPIPIHLGTCLTNYPDNVEQQKCFSTTIKPSPWGIRLAQSSNVFAHPHYTPLAGDLDNDGIPEFVAVKSNYRSNPNGSLIVFEGNDVTQSHEIIINENFSYYSGSVHGLIRLTDELNPSDTIGLIVVRTDNALRSYKYESITSIPSFKTNTTNIPPFGTIGFADFNNDGKPEIYTGNKVFDAYSLDYIGGGNSNQGLGYFHWNLERVSFAADVLPLVAGTELICGSVIYSVDVANKAVTVAKTITPPSGFVSDGQTEVADFNGDGLLDVLVKQNSSTFGIYAYDPRTDQILFSKSIASGTAQNYPMIGDLNADGKPEIVLLYENTMEAYTYDGTSLNKFWSISVTDASGSTGMTLFDFNQDGLKEIVYRDEVNLRIINGSLKSHFTGADTIVYNLSAFPITSSTTAEYPLVVDCDADGEAEIVSIGDITGGFLMTDCRLHVYKSLLPKTWPSARPVWNQYAYNVTNVNKDLTIPSSVFNNASYFANGKQPFNNFLEQATTLNENGDPFIIGEPDTTRIDTTIFKGQSYTFGTKIYTTSVRDTLQFKNISGCDSLVILNLTVLDFYPDNIEIEDCFKIPTAFDFKIKQLAESSTNVPTYCTPIVGDIDDDGEVEIITFSGWKPISTADYVSKNISIFNGTTLDLEASITTPIAKWEQVIALGDVDGVGGEPPYIFLAADSTYGYSSGNVLNPVQDALYVYAYKFDKTSSQYVQVWKSDTKIQEESSAAPVQVADLNNDGLAEVIVGNDVFNGKTGVLLARNKITKIVSPIMFRITPFIGNLLGDNKLELAYHNDVYSVNLSNTNAFNTSAFTKIVSSPTNGDIGVGNPVGADFNLDGHLDLAIVMRVIYDGYSTAAPIRIAVWDVYNNTILASVKTPDIYAYNGYKVNSSVPLVGDVNNDGVPEICFTTYNSMYCYAYDGTSTLEEYWNYTAITDQSGATGITLFDFNQDGKQEIVYRDESSLYILDGSTKNDCKLLTSIGNCYSGTGYEMPIIADVNEDNAAEIVTIGAPSMANYGSVRVYASGAINAWAPARPVWNQAPYNVVHVNKDLTIPSIQFNEATLFSNGTRPFNAYLQQVTTLNQNGDPFYALQKDTFQLADTICEGKIYLFYGDTIKAAGTYFKSTTCDSTYILNLTVNPIKLSTVVDSLCAGEVYSYNGKNYSAPGTFVDTLLSISGCDSIVTIVLTHKQAVKTVINRNICSGQFFDFGGIRLESSGTYIDSLSTSFGCDSIVILNLMVLSKDTVYQSIVINQGETYAFNGQALNITGIYTANLINSNSCDSLVILDLVVTATIDKVKPPEVFTPNNDGKNDYFVIENLENYPRNDILIFNRWGNKVYEGKPYMNNWDGRNYFDPKLGGNLLPEGTYFYLLNLGDGSDVIRGYIYLNR